MACLAVAAAAFWMFHGSLFEAALRAGLGAAARAADLHIEAERITVRLGRPVVLEGVSIRSARPWDSDTEINLGQVEVSLSGLDDMIGPRGRLIARVAVRDGRIFVDASTSERAPANEPMQRLDTATKQRDSERLAWMLPKRIALERLSAEVATDGGSLLLETVSAVFDESRLGVFTAAGMEVRFGDIRQVFAAQHGVTAWKDGAVFLAEMTLRQGMKIENLSVQFARPGGVGLDLEAEVFGGLLRGGAFFGEQRGEPGVDAALWASGVRFRELFQFVGLDGRASGQLSEGRFTFRGNPDRPMDAEASLRLSAEDFRWGERGWQTLEAAASLINRRLVLTDLKFKQADNSLAANGEVALAGDWKDVTASPFLLNVSASIHDMGSLAGLLGSPFDEMTGRMSLSASLSGRAEKPEGFLALEASEISLRGRSIESTRLDVLFVGGEARVERLEVWSDRDRFAGMGTLAVAPPHEYSGSVDMRVEDLGAYAWIGENPLPVAAGRLQLQWQGDGNTKAHSGAFHASMENVVTEATPEGLTGRFAGTYSPGNIYFAGFELEQGPLTLSLRATLAESGVKVDDVALRSSSRVLALGEAFLPLDPFMLLRGHTLAEAALTDRYLHAGLRSQGELPFADLLALAGRKSPYRGSIRGEIQAAGTLERPEASAVIRGRDLAPEAGGVPLSQLELSVSVKDGLASAVGSLSPSGLPPLRLTGSWPLGLVTDSAGNPQWSAADGAVQGLVELPGTDLAVFRPFAPNLHQLAGRLAGRVEVSGTVSSPVFAGELDLQGGEVQFTPRSPVINDLQASLALTASEIKISKLDGQLASGPFSIRGSVSLEDLSNPRYDLTLEGREILLHRSTDARLRADVSLAVKGDKAGGRVAGSLLLVDGRIFKRIEITPFIAPSPEQKERPFVPPDFRGLVPDAVALWDLDVRVANATPFEMVGNIASGSIVPDLKLGGTLGAPVPSGTITVQGARAYLPFTSMDISEGEIRFLSNDPWMPYLEVRATAQTQDYDVFLHAYGALRDRNLILRSDPPLSQEALVVLLGTGFAPGYFSGAGFGEAAAGQGGLLLLRSLLRQFDIKGVDTESFINRLQISSAPPRLPGERSTLRGRLNLWRGLSLTSAQDEMGYWNLGVSYRLRFR